MKPPPRVRTKRDLSFRTAAPEPRRTSCRNWGRGELKKLLSALKTLHQSTGGLNEIDFVLLKKHIPTRSISEITVMVDSLKKKVISSARFQLRMRKWEENQIRSSVEEWTNMASALAGTLETVISAAFSQMLIVSSTEPCTLRNCDPYQDPRPIIGHGGDSASVPSAMLLITPAPSLSGARRLPAPSKVVRVQTGKILRLQNQTSSTAVASTSATSTSQTGYSDSNSLSVSPGGQTTHLLPEKLPESITFSSPKPLTSSASDLSPVPTAAQSVVTSCSLPVSSFSSTHSTIQLSNTATKQQPKFGQTGKHATVDSPKTFGDKFVVDFEKIYKFLSVIQKPCEDFPLTPMESAIILDLLMSLPEELPYLDCKNLNTHLIQMYQCISAPVDSQPAKQLLSKLKNTYQAQSGQATAQDSTLTCSQKEETVGTTNGSLDIDKGHTSSGQSKDADMLSFIPPLNPFLVPLNLLMRRQSSE